MGMTFCHWVAAQAQLDAVGQVYAAGGEKLSLYGTNPGWSEKESWVDSQECFPVLESPSSARRRIRLFNWHARGIGST
jgi:hypothetical protein